MSYRSRLWLINRPEASGRSQETIASWGEGDVTLFNFKSTQEALLP